MEKEHYDSTQRRLRTSQHIRELVADVSLHHKEFIQPLFLDESVKSATPLQNLNEVNADSIDSLLAQIESDLKHGVSKFLIFPVPTQKTIQDFDFTFFTTSIRKIKATFGDRVWLAADVCLCAYTAHGHCGVLHAAGNRILNHESVVVLSRYASELAAAGTDCIAPSDMTDGRVRAIRKQLNNDGYDHVSIMSYSSKFSSQFYGPFRDACKSSPGNNPVLKDRKTYQISALNLVDALASAERDVREGADLVMVKPALPYLDVIKSIKQAFRVPIAAYHVSGEYQSIELLAAQALADRAKAHLEVWTAIKRAGSNIIISYAARHAKNWISKLEY